MGDASSSKELPKITDLSETVEGDFADILAQGEDAKTLLSRAVDKKTALPAPEETATLIKGTEEAAARVEAASPGQAKAGGKPGTADQTPSQSAPQDKAKDPSPAAKQTTAEVPVIDPSKHRAAVRSISSFAVSAIVHAILLIALSLLLSPGKITNRIKEIMSSLEERPQEELNQLLDQELDPAAELSMVATSATAVGAETVGAATSTSTTREIKELLESNDAGPPPDLGTMDDISTSGAPFIADLPDGAVGEPSSIVDSYSQAMDIITMEILNMLENGKVMVIWCFDQSESMKDDQEEIRTRIHKVYEELGLANSAQGDALLTAVCSYGEDFRVHLDKPTYDIEEISTAIQSVPVDPTGKEMMCTAVGKSIAEYSKFAHAGRRQLALILVTDESGEPADNEQNLELAIQQAKDDRCRVYVLGREAVFGYPYAHISWTDPKSGWGTYIAINRGPETAFPEALQVDGITVRYDAHSSGFGPYEECRLAYQTGGIFFMLPSPEAALAGRNDRKFELEKMRPYLPDLGTREKYLGERNKDRVRSLVWQIIADLNPYDPNPHPNITVPTSFPIEREALFPALQSAKEAALRMAEGYDRADKMLTKLSKDRERMYSPRWEANYDLMLAQSVAYKVRAYEYAAYMDAFQQEPKIVKNIYGPTKKTNFWGITSTNITLTDKETLPERERAMALLKKVIERHPGTPWAARAEYELSRGFGISLEEGYSMPRPSGLKVPNL